VKAKLKFIRPNPTWREWLSLAIISLLIAIDQFTKWLVVRNIPCFMRESCNRMPTDVETPLFKLGELELIRITHIHNDGAAFGILSGWQAFLITITSVFLVGAIIAILARIIKDKLLLAAVTLIVGGGIGNLIDRVSMGYVIDFIELRFTTFAIFNFADVFAVAGAILMCYAVIAEEIRIYRAKRACEVSDEVDDFVNSESEEKSENAS